MNFKLHVNIIKCILHDDIIYLVCRGQKYMFTTKYTKYVYFSCNKHLWSRLTAKEVVAHTILNFPIGVAWKNDEINLFSYVKKTHLNLCLHCIFLKLGF